MKDLGARGLDLVELGNKSGQNIFGLRHFANFLGCSYHSKLDPVTRNWLLLRHLHRLLFFHGRCMAEAQAARQSARNAVHWSEVSGGFGFLPYLCSSVTRASPEVSCNH